MDLLVLLAIIFVPIAIGVIPALIAFVPPIRRAARQSGGIRIVLMLICALIACATMYMLMAYLANQITMVFYRAIYVGMDHTGQVRDFAPAELSTLEQAASRELWIRQMIPFTNEGACYTTFPECKAADELVRMVSPDNPVGSSFTKARNPLFDFGVAFIPAAISAGTVWLITRKPQNSKMRLGYQSIHKELDLHA